MITDKDNKVVQVAIILGVDQLLFHYNVYENLESDFKIPCIGDTYIPDDKTYTYQTTGGTDNLHKESESCTS